MSKIKWFLGVLSCLFLIGICSPSVNAETVPGTTYEVVSNLELYDNSTNELYTFDSENAKQLFLQGITNTAMTRSTSPNQTRTRITKQYTGVRSSGYLVQTVYGGAHGGTMSRSTATTASIEGLSVSVSTGVSYNVPARKYGNIVIKANIQYTVHALEIRYTNNGAWKPAGGYTTKRVLSSWYAPVYWG